MAIKGRLIGHEDPDESYGYELRVLGAVIRQALEDLQEGDRYAEDWLAEVVGLGRGDAVRLARWFANPRPVKADLVQLQTLLLSGEIRGLRSADVMRCCGCSYNRAIDLLRRHVDIAVLDEPLTGKGEFTVRTVRDG